MTLKIQMVIPLLLLATALHGQGRATVAEVQPVQDISEAKAEPEKHKHHDASIYKTGSDLTGYTYTVIYYQKENEVLRYHKGVCVTSQLLNKAEYRWANETLEIRLYNEDTKNQKKFTLVGHGGTSSMTANY